MHIQGIAMQHSPKAVCCVPPLVCCVYPLETHHRMFVLFMGQYNLHLAQKKKNSIAKYSTAFYLQVLKNARSVASCIDAGQ